MVISTGSGLVAPTNVKAPNHVYIYGRFIRHICGRFAFTFVDVFTFMGDLFLNYHFCICWFHRA